MLKRFQAEILDQRDDLSEILEQWSSEEVTILRCNIHLFLNLVLQQLLTASALDNIGGNLGFLNPQRFQLLRSLLLSIHERPVSMDSRIFRGAIRKKYEIIYDGMMGKNPKPSCFC